MEKTLTEAAQILQRISKGAAMQRDWEEHLSGKIEQENQVETLAGIFGKEAPEAKGEEPKHEKIEETTRNEEGSIESNKNCKPEEKGRSLANAKSLKEFEQMDWIPVDFGGIFSKRRPYPNQKRSVKAMESSFPPEKHLGYELDKQSAGEIIEKLFNEEEEIDPDHVAEVKRIMGVKPESSPFAHLAEVCAIEADHVEGTPLPTPHIKCTINGKMFHKALCDIGAHVSVMSSKIYDEHYKETLNLVPTPINLIMGDGRTTKPLGVLRDLDISISGKAIPTDFFVIDAYHDEHDDLILGRPFLKLVNAVLDAGKGRVTIDLDGIKHTYDFLPASRIALPLPLDDEEVESLCFVENFRDPLQRAMENDVIHNDQDEELVEATEGLTTQYGSVEEEKFEDIGDLRQEEPKAPEVELKPLPKGLKYEFLGANKTYPVIVSDELNTKEVDKLLNLVRRHKKVIGYSINDLKGVSPSLCTHRIQLEEQHKPVVEHQRRLSHAMRDVVKKEVIK
jgi:hypothetical protein